MIAAGLLGLLAVLLVQAPEAAGQVSLTLFNDHFTRGDWVYHLLIVGGIYVISPNLFSRNFAAKDAVTARRATLWAAPLMALMGVVIAYIGCYAAASGLVKPGQSVFPVLSAAAGFPWSLLLGMSILAAIVSSADTTLLVTASIAQQDLCKRESVTGVRLWVAAIAGAAVLLVLFAPGATLYTLLFAAYNLFAPAVVPLVFAGFYAPRRLEPALVWAALAIGVAAGLYGNASALIATFGGGAAEWESARLYAGRTGKAVLTAGFAAASLVAAAAVWRARRA
jgi:SSS family solute:Na+ symporter